MLKVLRSNSLGQKLRYEEGLNVYVRRKEERAEIGLG